MSTDLIPLEAQSSPKKPLGEVDMNVESVTKSLDKLSTIDTQELKAPEVAKTNNTEQTVVNASPVENKEKGEQPQPTTEVPSTPAAKPLQPLTPSNKQRPKKKKPYFKKPFPRNNKLEIPVEGKENAGPHVIQPPLPQHHQSSCYGQPHRFSGPPPPLSPMNQQPTRVTTPQFPFSNSLPPQGVTIVRTPTPDGTGFIERVYPNPSGSRSASFYGGDPYNYNRPNYLEYFPPSDFNQINLPQYQNYIGSNQRVASSSHPKRYVSTSSVPTPAGNATTVGPHAYVGEQQEIQCSAPGESTSNRQTHPKFKKFGRHRNYYNKQYRRKTSVKTDVEDPKIQADF
ncbi:unnamed protein product [Ambrosiozyma monospora]|uniref:Unnamed protein product n=1 Tax=Ambrosiozyma monospora TaxID=43982 RepID=A0ACB5T8K4_AMBMO|nr:unnamed protein product [Ambrosiozyma monospora]